MRYRVAPMNLVLLLGLVMPVSFARAEEPFFEAQLVFPLRADHNHAPAIVECPNGDLLASWYRGSGEQDADDVAVYGARLRKGANTWSEPFVMADTPGFPDGNTAMYIDGQDRLWLFWPVILANSWESCLTHYRIAREFQADGPPNWEWQGDIPLVPRNFEPKMDAALAERLKAGGPLPDDARGREKLDQLKRRIHDKLYQRLGWQTRCKPTVLPSGRILLPLYSDTFSAGIMAITDDGGKSWYASEPIAGFGSIQPSVLRRKDGTLVAFMRENGPLKHVRVSESKDDGLTWGPVGVSVLPNPGSGLDGLVLADGRWLLVYNDTTKGRNSLAVSISADEGRTWGWTRHLERSADGAFHYPAVIQTRDGRIHVIYSYFLKTGKTMKHAVFDEAWVGRQDDARSRS